MPQPTSPTSTTPTPVRRADARQNIAAILEAATDCLARDPAVSVNEIAKAAGVGRVTLYGHFASRAALIAEVVDRAMKQTEEALAAVDLTGDPRDALSRLLDATWELTFRYGALVVAAQDALPAAELQRAHAAPAQRVERLLRRGRREGQFRKDAPIDWQVATIQAVLHAAVASVHRDEITPERAPVLVRDTVLAALTPAGQPVPGKD